MANSVESLGSGSCSVSVVAKTSSEVDRISSLPNSVIQHILSFLPTKDAVATSVLSTKWAKQWRLVPKLEFHASVSSQGNGQRFVNFVNWVFLLNKAPILESVRIYPRAHVDSSCIGTWMEIALDRGVKEIDIFQLSLNSVLLPLKSVSLPICLFTSKTLLKLKLTVQTKLIVPAYVHLPCLKILHLVGIEYPNEESIMRFLGGCPILEDFLMCRHWLDSMPNLVISIPTLKRLDLYAHKLDHRKFRCNLVLNSPSLEYLDLKRMVITTCLIENLAALLEARVEIPCYLLSEFLKSFHRIQKLSLTIFDEFGSENCSDGCVRKLTQTFHHLIRLEINVVDHHWNLFLELLGCCPKLQVLTLVKDFHYRRYGDLQLSKTQILPESLSADLKTFLFEGFSGSQHELQLVEYILKTARSLETVKICHRNMAWEEKYGMLENLLSLARSSSACKIVLDEEGKQNKYRDLLRRYPDVGKFLRKVWMFVLELEIRSMLMSYETVKRFGLCEFCLQGDFQLNTTTTLESSCISKPGDNCFST